MIVTQSNEHFNPDAFDTEVHGFCEELIALAPGTAYGFQLLGVRSLPGLPDRPMGSQGMITYELTAPVTLRKGHKEIQVKASKAKPIVVRSMLQAVCGRLKKPYAFTQR